MNMTYTGIGIILMVIGAFLTFISFGIGIICTWPLLLIGFLLFIVGIAKGEKQTNIIQPTKQNLETDRHCPNCGKAIPSDARICPYCEKKFW